MTRWIRRHGFSASSRRLLIVVAVVLARPEAAHAASADQASEQEPLPPLPSVPSLEMPKPDPERLTQLDTMLAAFASQDPEERRAAALLPPLDDALVPGIAFKLGAIADGGKKLQMKALLLDVRKQGRSFAREQLEAEGQTGKVQTPDYLEMLVQHGKPDAPSYADLVSVVAMSRMLTKIGSVQAVRTLITIYVRFGEFLRVDTQLQLQELGDRALAALIEAQHHPAEKIGKWARRQLDALGRAVPSEAIQTSDPQVLCDVLRAYGRIKDPDAARIIVSFAGSERALVREAARQAIAMMGEVGTWQLRDSYETLVGKRPPRDWSWERAARELLRAYDRMRRAPVADAFQRGQVARKSGDLAAMREAYNQVLARDPGFDRREALAEGYLAYAEANLEDHPEAALDALSRTERLTENSALGSRARSLSLTLNAAESLKHGVADLTLLDRALEVDPSNQRARALSDQIRRGDPDRASQRARQLAAATVALGALAAILVLLRRRREPDETPPVEAKPS